jgi:hypothetical protein
MLKRLSYAFVGASIVTFVLILGMSEIAKYFERPDSVEVYMRVMDFIPGSGARRLPDRRMPEAAPERARVGSGEITTQQLEEFQLPAEFEQETQDIDVRVELDPPPAQ